MKYLLLIDESDIIINVQEEMDFGMDFSDYADGDTFKCLVVYDETSMPVNFWKSQNGYKLIDGVFVENI